jgi:hypothetical protein
MEVVVMKIVREEGSAVVTGGVGPGVGPLAGDGLDETFGLAVGLGAIRFGEEMFKAELMARGGEGFGAIGGATIGQDLLDFDTVSGVEADGLLQSVEHARSPFVWEQTSEGEAGVVVDGDVETFDAGSWVAEGAIAGGADSGLCEAAQLLDVEVEEVARGGAFVAQRGRFGRFERREAIEVMTAQDAGKSSLGDGQNHHDLSVGATLAAQSEDLGFELGAGLARLAKRPRGMIVQALREPGLLSAGEPSTNRLLTDAESNGGGPQGEAELSVLKCHLGSGQRSKSGISVHVVRAQKRWVES